SASAASATNASAPPVVDTSATSPTASGPRRAAASLMRPASRPQMATRTPSAARASATPKPSPPDAAATAALRPAIPRSMSLSYYGSRRRPAVPSAGLGDGVLQRGRVAGRRRRDLVPLPE